MAKRTLQVFLYGTRVGELSGSGLLISSFEYVRGYSGTQLSHSLPATRRKTGSQVAGSWFEGLLPEGHERRSALAQAHGSRDTSAMGLLGAAGLDCAGAVQVSPDTVLPEREAALETLTDREVGERLRGANEGNPVAGDGERWSVAGQQGKIALHLTQDGRWARAIGGLPTTHILKPGITHIGAQAISDQALAEHLTLAAAAKLGVQASATSFQEFDGTPAVVVERYDRAWLGAQVHRIHQEDLCQALGVDPSRKYEDQGGPGIGSISKLLDAIAEGPALSLSLRRNFARMTVFNYLSGSPDAHAKNYSILLLPNGAVRLAPMYDAATGLSHTSAVGKLRFPKSAMKIGAHDAFGAVTEGDWRVFAGQLGLSEDWVLSTRRDMAAGIPQAFRDAISACGLDRATSARVLGSGMLERMSELGQT